LLAIVPIYNRLNWMIYWLERYIKLKALQKRESFIPVRVPVALNVIGQTYHLESSFLSPREIYLKIYLDDLEYLPPSDSNIVLFLSLNLYSRGKFEVEGKITRTDKLKGNRAGLLISFFGIDSEITATITDFVYKYYSPRYSVRLEAVLIFQNREIYVNAVNLSRNGIFIETETELFSKGDYCKLKLFLGNSTVIVEAIITWLNNGSVYDKPNGLGMKFLHDKTSSKAISAYITELEKKSEIMR
jgi:Tfp pilus assembly protein PilZ